MKFKLKDINFQELKLIKKDINSCKITNVSYHNEALEFQTPKVILESIITENDRDFFLLKVIAPEACKNFFKKINELEEHIKTKLKGSIKSIIKNDAFILKIPVKSKPKIYDSNNNLFNYYHLVKGNVLICLVSFDKIWTNEFNENTYNLNVKEIMLLKN
jgi:hypothetical protein